MTIVAPTDRPKSVRIAVKLNVFVSSLCNFDLHFLSFWGVYAIMQLHQIASIFSFPPVYKSHTAPTCEFFCVAKQTRTYACDLCKQFALISFPLKCLPSYMEWHSPKP